MTTPPTASISETDCIAHAVSVTPAFVYDERRVRRQLALLERVRNESGCRILYSIKAFPFAGLLRLVSDQLDGFSVSSLFEARLAAEILQGSGAIHFTSPGLRRDEVVEISDLCDSIHFNSLSQWERFAPLCEGRTALGLRINPQHSFLDDPRYDPCRPHSKLGVTLPALKSFLSAPASPTPTIEGLHFHTLFSSRSFLPLRKTVEHIECQLDGFLHQLKWINLGGGYLFNSDEDLDELCSVVQQLRQRFGLTVYFEPGKGVIGAAGHLVASVIDLFESDGKTIAILDTSVNHHPETFEYQTQPELAGEQPDGPFSVIIAGGSCLSGDLFGEYQLLSPLHLGDRVVFNNVGAYSLIKANRFNGHNLPTIHARDEAGLVRVVKQYDYEAYRQQWIDA